MSDPMHAAGRAASLLLALLALPALASAAIAPARPAAQGAPRAALPATPAGPATSTAPAAVADPSGSPQPARRAVAVAVSRTPRAPDAEALLVDWMRLLGAERRDEGPEITTGSALALAWPMPAAGADAQPGPLARWRAEVAVSDATHLAVARVLHALGRYSVQVELRAAGRAMPLRHFALVAGGEAELAEAFAVAAQRVRAALGRPEPPRPLYAQARDDAPAPAPSADRQRVAEVRVVGFRAITADAILNVVGTQKGDSLRGPRIAADVRRIYEMGFFANVQVLRESTPEGWIVTFVVEENPKIHAVYIAGNEEIGNDDIRERMTLTVGSTLDYPRLIENKLIVESVYRSKGFYLAEVRYQIEESSEGRVDVTFDVQEGEKLRLRRIEWNGNASVPDDDLMDVVQTRPWRWYSHLSRFWDNSGLYTEALFLQDLDRVKRMYGERGFISAAISEPDVEVGEDGLVVRVDVVEGPQFSVGLVDVLGDATMDPDALLEEVELEPGEIFNARQLSEDSDRLEGHYADLGFFDARVRPRTAIDPGQRKIDVSFEVEKGELYFVGRIDVNGNTQTRDPVIRRELSLDEGELYSRDALRRSQTRVRRLGFFEEVNVDAQPLDVPNRVNVAIDVVERSTGTFSFGAGIGSTDGFVISGSISQANLFGQGRGLNASIDLGQSNRRVFINYVEPYAFGTAATLAATISSREIDFPDFEESISGLTFNYSYPLDESETVAGTGYSFSRRKVSGVDDFQASSLLQREEFQGTSTTSQWLFSLRRDTRDDIRFPTRGQVTGAAVEFAGLGGLNRFVRLEGRTTHWLPVKPWLGFDSTFIINSRVGWVVPMNDIGDFDLPSCTGACASGLTSQIQPLDQIDRDLELPLTERYFLGGLGAFQLRGFKQRTLGPRRTILNQLQFSNGDRSFFPSGLNTLTAQCAISECNDLDDTDIDDFEDLDLADVIGGNKMFLLNLELQFPLSEDLGLTGVVFLDMGNAFAENESIDPAEFRFGTGAGVQWFSPFGPILVVLGVPIDRLSDEDATVFEFSLGGSQF